MSFTHIRYEYLSALIQQCKCEVWFAVGPIPNTKLYWFGDSITSFYYLLSICIQEWIEFVIFQPPQFACECLEKWQCTGHLRESQADAIHAKVIISRSDLLISIPRQVCKTWEIFRFARIASAYATYTCWYIIAWSMFAAVSRLRFFQCHVNNFDELIPTTVIVRWEKIQVFEWQTNSVTIGRRCTEIKPVVTTSLSWVWQGVIK